MYKFANHILYLDDEQENLDLFSMGFSKQFNVHVTKSLNEAKRILNSHEIKVVLTDQRMPEIKGIDFIKLIKQNFPHIVCIIISGYADKEVLFKAINEIDVFRFIEKPGHFEEIKHAIEKAIEKYDSEKEKQCILSELKKALDKSQESDRLKAEFLGSISHEIRTPVNGIVGFAELIKNSSQNSYNLIEYLEVVTDSANKLIGIIDDIIMASRINAGELSISENTIYLNDLLDELYEDFLTKVLQKPEIKIEVFKRQGNNKISITTDKEKLYFIFMHLLKNALKFTAEGNIEFGIFDEEKQIFFVKDTGCGISESDKHVVYDFFRQGMQNPLSSEIEGIGVGLSIVKGLINLMNGKVWFESGINRGTTFYFTFHVSK